MLKLYTEYRKTKQKTALVSAVCCYNKGQWNWQFSMLVFVVNVGSACLTQVCETVARMLVTRITLMRNDSAVLLHSLVWSNWNAALWAGFPGLKGAVLYNEGALYVYFAGSWAPPVLNYWIIHFFLNTFFLVTAFWKCSPLIFFTLINLMYFLLFHTKGLFHSVFCRVFFSP